MATDKEKVEEGLTGLIKLLDVNSEQLIKHFLSGIQSLFKNADLDKVDNVKDFFADIETSQWEGLVNSYIKLGIIDNAQASEILALKDTAHPWDWFLFIAVMVSMFMNNIARITSPTEQLREIANNQLWHPRLPSEFSVLNAAFIAPEKTGEVREVLDKMGIPEKYVDLMFIAAYRLYDEETIKTLSLRGILSPDETRIRMREHGYTDKRIDELVQAWQVIPGPQDLLWMVSKEAFEEDTARDLGLDAEFPEDQVKWLKAHGVSEFWAKKYWRAHWIPPQVGHGFDMLHRGVIDKDGLDLLFKTQEVPPIWRDRLTQIAYNPYTRVDVRRMHAVGVVNDAELLRAYMDLGYNEEKAEKMALFTIAYNSRSGKNLTKAQILSGYRKRLIGLPDAKALLIDIGYSEPITDYMIAVEDFKDAEELQDEVLRNVKLRYEENLIEKNDAIIELNKLNLPADQINILIERWELTRYKDRKIPSRRDFENFVLNGVMSFDEYRIEMRKLGYNSYYTTLYENYLKIRKDKLENG